MDLNIAIVRVLFIEAVFGIPIAYYIYRDANRRGDRWPLVRGAGLGLLLIAGLSIHVLWRTPDRAD